MTASNILTALIVNGQIPLDGKTYFLTQSSMTNLGTGDQKAFTYYEGMEAYCNETKKKYIWREVLAEEDPDNPGLIAGHYTYPAGAVAEGITYSGRSFNFFETGELLEADVQELLGSYIAKTDDIQTVAYLTQTDFDAEGPGRPATRLTFIPKTV